MATDKQVAAKKNKFLARLRKGLSVTDAARAAGVDRTAPYRWKDTDTKFAARWEQAELAGTDYLADEARRRAVDGVTEPIFFDGIKVGEKVKYSDGLLMFLLKAHNPEKYGDKTKLDVAGHLSTVSDEDLNAQLGALLKGLTETKK